jgi:hypothetical protein
MLQGLARPFFLAACGCNLAFSLSGAFAVDGFHIAVNVAALGGALSFIVATVLGLAIVGDHSALQRQWIKAAMVFLTLGPVAFWSLQWPAARNAICMGWRCYGETAIAFRLHAAADVVQTHVAMVAVAAAAVFCAAIVVTEPLEELAA